jgi:hypothetical protein
MNSVLVITLIFADLILLVAIYRLGIRQKAQEATISDLTEERLLLKDMQERMRNDLALAETRQKELFNRFSQLAAEAEEECSRVKAGVQETIEEISREVSQKFETPLKELMTRQGSIELQYKKIKAERESMERTITRGQELAVFFNKNSKYEDVLSEIQDKKYEDARVLIAKGNSVDSISKTLGMTRSEVELVRKFVHSGL